MYHNDTGTASFRPCSRITFKYDDCVVLDTVMMGNARLYEIMKEKEAIYAKEDFTDEDGIQCK